MKKLLFFVIMGLAVFGAHQAWVINLRLNAVALGQEIALWSGRIVGEQNVEATEYLTMAGHYHDQAISTFGSTLVIDLTDKLSDRGLAWDWAFKWLAVKAHTSRARKALELAIGSYSGH